MVDVIMPKMGESITEGTILEWKKKVGDHIELDETLLEISTDKVDSEVPSPAEGIIAELLFDVNDVVEVGAVIARIRSENESPSEPKRETPSPDVAGEPEETTVNADDNRTTGNETKPDTQSSDVSSGRFYSPLVRSIAAKEGISAAELKRIPGSGKNLRVTKKDILAYLEMKKNRVETAPLEHTPAAEPMKPDIKPQSDGNTPPVLMDTRVPMGRVRKRIAEHMIASQRTSAHVYSTSEADVTNLVDIRRKHKDRFREKYGLNLTYTPMIIQVILKTIQEFPMMNASIDGDDVVYHKNINMGVAVALPDNNLIVPVIHRSEELNFLGLARKSSELAHNARAGKLQPDDIFGSTFTVTNPGVFGSLFGMAIINQPNVGILSVGAIHKRPVVKETEFGDVIAIRSMMYLTLGYDHRIIDGAYGTRFLTRLCELLESFDETSVF